MPHLLLKTQDTVFEHLYIAKHLNIKHLRVLAKPNLYLSGNWRQAKFDEFVTGL